MIAPSSNSLCNEAELYYYDFLFKESQKAIPKFIIKHIEQCRYCQQQLNQLKDVLSQADSKIIPEKRQNSSAISEILKLHFVYIGKPVTCETARPFLPTLLEPALEVRIPTPITVHLDNCPQCSKDLETIRKLNLNYKQLSRLSQLFAENPEDDNINCTQAQAAILAAVSMAFNKTNKDILKHLCICPNCRKLLYQYRQAVCKDLLTEDTIKGKFPCENVSLTSIFDYVVPYGLDFTSDQYIKLRESLTSHISSCPTCLNKMQQLHNTVYGITERLESMVVTIYHIDESAKAKVVNESDNLYDGFPIRVEIISSEKELKAVKSIPVVDFGTASKRNVLTKRVKPLLRIAAVAAVILIGVALFLNVTTTKGITIGKIYKALEKVKNVHISSLVPDKKEPVQERWVSRTAKTYLLKAEKELVLWDIATGLRKSKHLNTGVTEMASLTEDGIISIETKISGSLGLMPFYDISDIPTDAEWTSIANNALEATTKGTEVYDLTWIAKAYDGSVVFQNWRVFVDPETNLPRRTEFYRKQAIDSEYLLESVKVVEYLDESEMQQVIKEAFF